MTLMVSLFHRRLSGEPSVPLLRLACCVRAAMVVMDGLENLVLFSGVKVSSTWNYLRCQGSHAFTCNTSVRPCHETAL